jgi:hypothetical protein
VVVSYTKVTTQTSNLLLTLSVHCQPFTVQVSSEVRSELRHRVECRDGSVFIDIPAGIVSSGVSVARPLPCSLSRAPVCCPVITQQV